MIPEEDQSLFQQLVNNDNVPQMIEDLENLEELVPDDEDPDDVSHWDLGLPFSEEDVPRILDELRELQDDDE